jgi:hypothetical protein
VLVLQHSLLQVRLAIIHLLVVLQQQQVVVAVVQLHQLLAETAVAVVVVQLVAAHKVQEAQELVGKALPVV